MRRKKYSAPKVVLRALKKEKPVERLGERLVEKSKERRKAALLRYVL